MNVPQYPEMFEFARTTARYSKRAQQYGDCFQFQSVAKKNQIISCVNGYYLFQLADVADRVWNKYHIRVSKRLIVKSQKIFIIFQKNYKNLEKRKIIYAIESRINYDLRFRNFKFNFQDKNFIFLDEIGFQVVFLSKKGRSKI